MIGPVEIFKWASVMLAYYNVIKHYVFAYSYAFIGYLACKLHAYLRPNEELLFIMLKGYPQRLLRFVRVLTVQKTLRPTLFLLI